MNYKKSSTDTFNAFCFSFVVKKLDYQDQHH